MKVWFQNRRTKHKRVVNDGEEEDDENSHNASSHTHDEDDDDVIEHDEELEEPDDDESIVRHRQVHQPDPTRDGQSENDGGCSGGSSGRDDSNGRDAGSGDDPHRIDVGSNHSLNHHLRVDESPDLSLLHRSGNLSLSSRDRNTDGLNPERNLDGNRIRISNITRTMSPHDSSLMTDDTNESNSSSGMVGHNDRHEIRRRRSVTEDETMEVDHRIDLDAEMSNSNLKLSVSSMIRSDSPNKATYSLHSSLLCSNNNNIQMGSQIRVNQSISNPSNHLSLTPIHINNLQSSSDSSIATITRNHHPAMGLNISPDPHTEVVKNTIHSVASITAGAKVSGVPHQPGNNSALGLTVQRMTRCPSKN